MNPLRAIFVRISRIPPALMLVAIVGLAAVATFLVNDMLTRERVKNEDIKAKLENQMNQTTKIVYAIKDVPEGQEIPSDALEERAVQQGKAPQDALSSTTLAAGRVAKYGIEANNPVSQHDLAPQRQLNSFEASLPQGMRAVTFGVDNNSGVAGFVQPQSHVDIISMIGAGQDTKAAPILSDVQIIAVGSTYRKAADGTAVPASSVTVAVTPEDTQKLIKGICASKLYLALRNDRDHIPVATQDVTSLFGRPGGSSKIQLAEIGQLTPPPIPNVESDISMLNKTQGMGNIAPPPKAMHEIEIWSASRKDVVTIAPQ